MEIQIRGDDQVWYTNGVKGTLSVGRSERKELTRLTIPAIIPGRSFYADGLNRITDFDVGQRLIANDGMDNVRLTYAVSKPYPRMLAHATAHGFYGADGGNEVLFLGGSDVSPGEDIFSQPNNFFCFYETSTERLGNGKMPITGYCRLNDGRMAVLKDEPNGSSVFFRSHSTVSLGTTQSGEEYIVDIYPSKMGAAVEGCVSFRSLGVVGNEPCFLGQTGVFSVRSVSNELTNLNETVRRSVPIDLAFQNLPIREVCGVCWNGYYMLVFGKEAYITDGRKESNGSFRFLHWVFGHEISAVGAYNDTLYLGDVNGLVHYLDGSNTDGDLPITAYWDLPLQEEDSGRRLLLRRLFAAFSGDKDETVKVEIIQDRKITDTVEIALNEGWETTDLTDDAHWVSLLHRPRLAKAISARLDLSGTEQVLLWGVRVIYEKGGLIS